MVLLSLGPIALDGFEVPSRVRLGGRQHLAVHRLLGGARVIDAMGRDDGDLVWSGIFSGPDAGERARLLDSMRAAGGTLPLSWDAFYYSVVISKLELDYCNPWWIAYRITCTVLRDEAQGQAQDAVDLATSVLADLTAASGFVDVSPALAATGVNGALTQGTAVNEAATLSLAMASGTVSDGITKAESGMQTNDLVGLVAASQTLAGLCCAQGFLSRAQTNFEGANG